MDNILDISPSQSIDLFFERVAKYRNIDKEALKQLAIGLIKCYKGDQNYAHLKDNKLEQRWYASLNSGVPDYNVYDADIYISDLWACWILFSRGYLKNIRNPKSLISSNGILGLLGNLNKVADIGCGFGYTTASLKQLFPTAQVVGTNLKDTVQYKVATEMGKEYGFRVVPTLDEIGGFVDLVFASEFFEHFYEPIDYLYQVLDKTQPKAMLIANSFNTKSVGHFTEYVVDGEIIEASKISKIFNTALQKRGYTKVKTKLWNNKPALWIR